MLLKRHYDPASIERGDPVLTHVEVKHTGANPEQNFSTSLVLQGKASGLITIVDDQLTLHVKPEALRYTIKRRPGYYCCHDGARIDISPEAFGDPALAAMEAQAYLASHGFAGKASPDKCNPAGYMRLHEFQCVLDAEQHARFKATPGALAPSTTHLEA